MLRRHWMTRVECSSQMASKERAAARHMDRADSHCRGLSARATQPAGSQKEQMEAHEHGLAREWGDVWRGHRCLRLGYDRFRT